MIILLVIWIKFFLQKEGYEVDSFTDSIETLNSYRKDKYDLVVLDAKNRKKLIFIIGNKCRE